MSDTRRPDTSPTDTSVEEVFARISDAVFALDDGSGIPEAERGRVFETGYTTHEANIGLGLTFIAQLLDTYD